MCRGYGAEFCGFINGKGITKFGVLVFEYEYFGEMQTLTLTSSLLAKCYIVFSILLFQFCNYKNNTRKRVSVGYIIALA